VAVVTGTAVAPVNPEPQLPNTPSTQATPVVEVTDDPSHYTGKDASVGNYVWFDFDHDGVQDPDETPVKDVIVTLQGPEGVLTTTTSVTGWYEFVGLTPGAPYVLEFSAPNGYTWTTAIGAPNDATNSDVNGNGRTAPIVLQPGENNPNIDAGVWAPPGVELIKATLNPGLTRVGNEIRYQIVVSNAGPSLARGVVLTDAIPVGTTYVEGSAAPAAVFADGKLVWRLGDMGVGGIATVTFSVRVNVNPGVATIVNQAQLNTEGRAEELKSNEVTHPLAPTAITLERFSADKNANGQGVRIEWRTSAESNTFGYNLYRSETGRRADAGKVNSTLIAATGNGAGAAYGYVDPDGDRGASYWLQEVELSGAVIEYGPALVAAPGGTGGVDAQGGALVFSPVAIGVVRESVAPAGIASVPVQGVRPGRAIAVAAAAGVVTVAEPAVAANARPEAQRAPDEAVVTETGDVRAGAQNASSTVGTDMAPGAIRADQMERGEVAVAEPARVANTAVGVTNRDAVIEPVQAGASEPEQSRAPWMALVLGIAVMLLMVSGVTVIVLRRRRVL
jgi:uncharacterized repeat protein (TIGR01451 family)